MKRSVLLYVCDCGIHTCVSVYMCLYLYMYVCVSVSVCMYLCVHLCVHGVYVSLVYMCLFVCVSVHLCICVHLCVCVCVSVSVCAPFTHLTGLTEGTLVEVVSCDSSQMVPSVKCPCLCFCLF